MIPTQLTDYPLIRVCRPNCRSHNNCGNKGKRPVTAADDPDPNNRIKSWINRSGNYGVVPTPENDLVIFDVDSKRMAEILDQELPSTFTVESGGRGLGQHWYYQCDQATEQRNWDHPEGGVNVDYWQVVGPGSVHAETGDKYEIIDDRPIARISLEEYQAVYDIFTEIHQSETASTVADVESGGGGSSDGSAARPLSTPNSLNFINSEKYRKKVARVLNETDAQHRDRLWLAGWLYSAAGLYQTEIVDLVEQECNWIDYDRSITSKMVSSVIRSTDSDRGTHPTEFGSNSTGDMGFLNPESRKTEDESGGSQPPTQEVFENMEDNVSKKSTVQRDNGRFARSGIVSVENNGDEWEYAGVVFGQIGDEDEELGTVVEFETNQYGDRDYKNLGNRSPEDLRLAAEALEELADEIEG